MPPGILEKYNKQKRTFEALSQLIEGKPAKKTAHLESISAALDIARTEADLSQIKEELQQFGYMKKRAQGRKGPGYKGSKKEKTYRKQAAPLYIQRRFSYVCGQKYYQNEEVTFQMADGGDWWFHAKGIPGSHVIVKTEGKELPDRTFLEAGSLAAYYSKGRGSDKVEIDYVKRKEVKKGPGGKPGFVIYHTNYSLMAPANIDGLEEIL